MGDVLYGRFDEPTYACPKCLDRGWTEKMSNDPKRTPFNMGEPFPVVASCRDCDRGAYHAAGFWRGTIETERGARRFLAWQAEEPEFARKVRTIIDAGPPRPRQSV